MCLRVNFTGDNFPAQTEPQIEKRRHLMTIEHHHIRQYLDRGLFLNARGLIEKAFEELVSRQSMWPFLTLSKPLDWNWKAFNKLADMHLEDYSGNTKMATLRVIGFLRDGDEAEFQRAKMAFKAEYPEERKYHSFLRTYEFLSRFHKPADSETEETELALTDRSKIKLSPGLLADLYNEARIGLHRTRRGPGKAGRAKNRARQKAEETQGRIRKNFEAFAYDLRDMLGPAIFLNPSPATDIETPAVCFFGGKPKMPPEMAWPCNDAFEQGAPMHFLAQIDCASLPRELKVGDLGFPMPDFPETGTFYLFMHLHNDAAWEFETKLIYRPEDPASLIERNPPENLFSMIREHHEGLARKYHTCEVDRSAIQPCGKLLVRQVLNPVAFLSANRESITRLADAYDNGLGSDEQLGLLLQFIGVSDQRARSEKPKPASKHNFGDHYGGYMMQMFGLGDVVQSAPLENADKVMMMQIGACYGLPLNLGGSTGLFQFWMKEEDLADRRFETIVATGEMT